jgi:hypothetical protein
MVIGTVLLGGILLTYTIGVIHWPLHSRAEVVIAAVGGPAIVGAVVGALILPKIVDREARR